MILTQSLKPYLIKNLVHNNKNGSHQNTIKSTAKGPFLTIVPK